MEYIVQENVFRGEHYDLLFETLNRLELKYTIVRVFPFFDKIVNLKDIPESFDVEDLPEYEPENKHLFVFGGSKLARLAALKEWHPGSLMNDNHDYEVYSKYYGDNLLNNDSIVQRVTEPIVWLPNESKFIRPTKDNKAFTGRLFTEKEWNEILENSLYNNHRSQFNVNTMIQIARPKRIFKEIRFWIVDSKIVTGSIYKVGDKVMYDEVWDEDAKAYVKSMIDIYEPAEAFVMDICDTEYGWKIVEINCLNCSGFYKADLQRLLMAIEDKYNN